MVKEQSREAIASLKAAGVKKTVMLTGDGKIAAKNVAAMLGVDEYKSELLPADKVAAVEELLAQKAPGRTWHLWETVSMMRRCCPGQISVWPWGRLDPMQPLKRPILS